jgi:hypothetical protein
MKDLKMKDFSPLEIAYMVWRAEIPEECFAKQVFEAGWRACESARRREEARATPPPRDLLLPHQFSSGGGSGIPDRPCVLCGWPDRHRIHAGFSRPAATVANVEDPAPVQAGTPGEANQKLIEVLDSLDEDISDLRCDCPPSTYRVKTQTLIGQLGKLLCSTDPPSSAKE